MNVLFITLATITDISDRGLYNDLLRQFSQNGHNLYILNPIERREGGKTHITEVGTTTILRVKTLNIQKVGNIEKGAATLSIEHLFLNAVKKYFSKVKFDLVIYTTPPITFTKVVQYVKKRDGAYTYLLLKDIFPQNAVDMKMLNLNGLLHKFFLKKERKLYKISDTIGCLSEANKSFLFRNNKNLEQSKVEINPNTIEPLAITYSLEQKQAIREKYNLPVTKKILVYGGNLGKPQGLDFLLECMEAVKSPDFFFLIVGDGTEYSKIENWFKVKDPKNAILLRRLPKEDYDKLLAACDVGLIFLHPDFTIPNFPLRLLSYLEMKLPVISVTDSYTDVGDTVEKAKCGFKVISGDLKTFLNVVDKLKDDTLIEAMQTNAWALLEKEFTVERSYNLIVEKLNV